MRRGIIIFIAAAAIAFAFGGRYVRASGPTYVGPNENILTPAVWTKENSPYVIKGTVNVYSKLTIESGTIVKFYDGTGLVIKSEFYANGTPYEKVFFTSYRDDSVGGDTNGNGASGFPIVGSWSGLQISSPRAVKFDHASVSYANLGFSAYSTNGVYDNVSIENSEIRNNGNGVYVYNTEPKIENCTISNNDYGIKVHTSSKVAKAVENSIYENRIGANGYNYSGSGQIVLDAKNNWWGAESGPQNSDNPGGEGNSAEGAVSFDPWLEKDPNHARRPVIIVPGIGGAVNWDLMLGGLFPGRWTLMSHTYDGLIEAFEKMGYEKDKSLFICYYDWRQNNDESAEKYLKILIDQAKRINSASKVNIIAHSMGGLVARSYVQSDKYQNDVDNLFLIGTPSKGSSDIYPVWEGGYIPKNWETRPVLNAYLTYLDTKKLTFNNYQSVHQYIPSVKQLMPLYDYIHPKEESQNLKNYASMHEVNTWLKDLNTKITTLNQRAKVSVISGNSQPTTNDIPVVSSEEPGIWVDGKPDPLDPERNDIRGDKRVLMSSSKITSLYEDVLNFDHSDIVDQSETIIAQRLSDESDRIYESPDIDNELAFWFASPVDVEITSPSGKKISKNSNNIPLSIFTGESKPDGFKFISIPNSESGDYKINLTGNGDGAYHAGFIYADYENGDRSQEGETEGAITCDEVVEYKLGYNPQSAGDPTGELEMVDNQSDIGNNGQNPDNSEPPEKSNSEIGNGDSGDSGGQNGTGTSLDAGDSRKDEVVSGEQTDIEKLDSLKGRVRAYFLSKQIKTRKESKNINKKLSHIRVHLKKYFAETSSKKLNILKKKTNKHIRSLITRIRRDFPKKIDEEARDYINGILEELEID